MLRPAGLGQKRRRQFRPLSLTDRHHDLPVAPHRLWQQPVPARPNAVGQADITWVETDEGWLYVAGIWDRCTRRGVGWARGDTLHPHLAAGRGAAGPDAATTTTGAGASLRPGRAIRPPALPAKPVGRRGNGYDNAARESFWSALKRARIYRRHFPTRSEARTALFEGSAVLHNRVRLPSALGFPSPVDLETHLN